MSIDETPPPASLVSPDETPAPEPGKKPRHHKKLLLVSGLLVILIGCGLLLGTHTSHDAERTAATETPMTARKQEVTPKTATVATLSSSDLKLDTTKNYGNKYTSGLLPVGDGKYRTDTPKQGYIYTCHIPQGGGGAGSRGPWFTNNNTQYDINKKAHVSGNVSWQSTYNMSVSSSQRVISTNDLPLNHTTGVFPVQPSDPAYRYDRNPNSIGAQSLTYVLSAYPSVGSSDGCIGGEVGVMTTGVALFDGFDAEGRDAGAWEVQDGCGGHPQNTHEYHYHTLSSCIKDTSVKTVIGYALDGFPITGPNVGTDNILTTSDLDECHGITSEINLDGKNVISYHYVMTQDFPYSVSCFKASAIQPPNQRRAP